MTSLRKNILTFTVMSGLLGYVHAAPVTVYSSFPSSINRLELDVKSRTPYKAYVKNSVNNLNALGSYGRISTDVSSLFDKYANTPGYDTPPKNSFSLSYFGASYDYIGQCVSFIRAVTNAGHTGLWYGTEKVSKNKSLPQYTPIATLTGEKRNGKPRYKGDDGKSHVAIYLKHHGNGILVIDQNFYLNGKLNVHYIPFSGSNQNNAGNYYILEQDWKDQIWDLW